MQKNIFTYFLLLLSTIFFINADEYNDNNYKEIKCSLKPIIRLRDENSVLRNLNGHMTHPHLPIKYGISSNNWAGYVAGTNLFNPSAEKNTVSFVKGVWKVPKIAASSKTTYCATWVGIDGFNNNTVEQIGTEQEYMVSSSFTGQFNYAWVEMFPQNAQIITGFPVNVGDVILGSVQFMGNNHFNLTLINRTKGVKTKIIRTLANPAQRISAEWIVEAPFLNGVLPLGNFKTINFTECKATIKGIRGAINNNHWNNVKIRMESPQGVVKAKVSALKNAGTAFSVVWNHN